MVTEIDLIKLLPSVYCIIGTTPKTRYDIVKTLELNYNSNAYRKIDELILMGFLKKTSNPQMFIADRKKIYDFLKKTPTFKNIMEMIQDNNIMPIE